MKLFLTATLLLGAIPPALTHFVSPFFVYGIVFFSFPLWGTGTLVGGIAFAKAAKAASSDQLKAAAIGSLANLAALILTALFSPAAPC